MLKDAEVIRHPSFAVVEIMRHTGGFNLFGSSIENDNCMSLTIKEASLERHLNEDYVFGGKTILTVRLSPAQWANMVSVSIGQLSGTPCTIRAREGIGLVDEPNFTDKRKEFNDEFRDDMAKQAAVMDELVSRVDDLESKKGTVSKTEIRELKSMIAMVRQDLASNMPFVLTQWQRHADNTVTEAKAEYEAFVSKKIEDIAMNALSKTDVHNLLEDKDV